MKACLRPENPGQFEVARQPDRGKAAPCTEAIRRAEAARDTALDRMINIQESRTWQ